MNEKYYVICGNRHEFDYFIRNKCDEHWNSNDGTVSLSHFVYVDGADRIKGISNPTGWFYGNWKNNPKIEEIMIQLAQAITDIKRQQIIRDLWKEYRK